MDFYQTRGGRKYYENHVPRIANALEKIAVELEKLNEDKEGMQRTHLEQIAVNKTLEQVASDIEQYKPEFARFIREYI